MPSRRDVCALDNTGLTLLKTSMARTAADLAGSPVIRIEDLAEAIHFRSLDREGWAG